MVGEIVPAGAGLRARKKALTRSAIEETALRLFTEHGYDNVRLEDVCAQCLVSLRTFFRYFNSKEDLVFGHLRARQTLAAELFRCRPEREPLIESIRTVMSESIAEFVAAPQREIARLRLVGATPALEPGMLAVYADFERLIVDFARSRASSPPDDRGIRLLAAASVTAFRIGLAIWTEQDGEGIDLPELISENLQILTRGWPSGQPAVGDGV